MLLFLHTVIFSTIRAGLISTKRLSGKNNFYLYLRIEMKNVEIIYLYLVGYSAIITVNSYAGDPIDCTSTRHGHSGQLA